MSLSNLHLPLYLHLYLLSVAHDDADDDSDGHDHAHHDDSNNSNNNNNTNNDNGNYQNNGSNDNNSSNSNSSKNSGRPFGLYTTGTCSAVGISYLTYRGVQRPFAKLDQGSQSLLPCGRRRAAAPAMLGRHLEGQKRHTLQDLQLKSPTTPEPGAKNLRRFQVHRSQNPASDSKKRAVSCRQLGTCAQPRMTAKGRRSFRQEGFVCYLTGVKTILQPKEILGKLIVI